MRRRDDNGVYILQQFWKAEIRDWKVTYELVDFGYGFRGRTTTKTYRTRAAAERAAQIELAKKLRLGYQALPAKALVALQRFANKQNEHRSGWGVGAAPKTYACRRQRFWRAEREGRVIVTTQGDIGGDESKTTANHAALADLHEEGYYLSTARELGALRGYVGKMNARLAKQPGVSTDKLLAIPPPRAPTIVPRRLATRPAAKVKRTGLFAKAFTGPVVHFIGLSPGKPSKPEAAPRATSGGRPIMAEGQAWPTCGGCREKLSLYMQFDIEPRMGLGFIPGSHLLVFNCRDCDGMATDRPGQEAAEGTAVADNPQTYRVILNRPPRARRSSPPIPAVL